jgi:hypothetical protein
VILVLTLAIAFGISGSANRKRLQLLVHLLTRHQEKQESAKDLEAV